MVKVGIVGSTGRMGEHLIKNILEDNEKDVFTESLGNKKIKEIMHWE